MIVSDVVKRVQRQFGDEASVQIEDADIIRYINDVTKEIAVQNDLTQATGTMNSVIGQNSYALPSDFLSLKSIYYNNMKVKPLKRTEYDEYIIKSDPDETQQGTPFIYTRWGTNFMLYPKPDAVKVIKLFYLQRPTEVSSLTDVIPLPTEYHLRVVEYCLQQAYQTDEDWDAATQMSAQFTDGMTRLKEQETFSDKEFYPVITILQDDM